MGRVPQHIRGENCGLDVEKFVRETAVSLGLIPEQYADGDGGIDSVLPCEVKDRPCVGRPMVASSGNVLGF